jgi:DNA-binding NarL/FixJ family response regulator
MPLSEAVRPRPDAVLARLLLVDDYAPVLEHVRELLSPEFEIVGTATSGRAMIESALRCQPDVIVADISMPDLDGIEATRKLRSLAVNCAVVFLSMNRDQEIVRAALATGALCYVLKIRAGTDLIPAIRQALEGRRFVSADIARETGLEWE